MTLLEVPVISYSIKVCGAAGGVFSEAKFLTNVMIISRSRVIKKISTFVNIR